MTAKEYNQHLQAKAKQTTREALEASSGTLSNKRGGSSCQRSLYKLIADLLGVDMVEEYRFAPPRRYRFDLALPELKIAVEYEGLNAPKSGHTSFIGYSNNCQKYNLATLEGWAVLRYTAKNYRDVINDLPKLIRAKKGDQEPNPELLNAVKKVLKPIT